MRVRSDTWQKLARHGRFTFDAKARINGKDYYQISAPVIERSLMTSPLGIGNCISATLSLSVLTEDDIPPKSEIVIMGRLLADGASSEWLNFGTFYINQRDTSYEGLIMLECYDAMLKANQNYIGGEDGILGEWPRTMKSVVEEIAYRIGVRIDPRTRIRTGPDYIVSYPEGKTMLQVLGWIGACHGGNWIITEDNTLRLVPLITAPDDTYHIIDQDYNVIKTADGYLLSYQDQEVYNQVLPPPAGDLPESYIPNTYYILDSDGRRIVTSDGYYLVWNTETGEAETVPADIDTLNIPVVCGNLTTGPRLVVSGFTMQGDDDDVYVSGTDDGYVLDIGSVPYASQQICDDLCAAYQGLVYLPFTATKALFDPAAELGDQVKIGDKVCSVICGSKVTLDHNYRADISAPNSEELTEEYPYLGKYQSLLLDLQEKAKSNRKEIDRVTVRLNRTDESIEAEIRRASGVESLIRQYAESLTLSVTNGKTTSEIALKAGDAIITSQTINLSGLVTFTSLSSSGTTKINGDNITTGTITGTSLRILLDADADDRQSDARLEMVYRCFGMDGTKDYVVGGIYLDDQGSDTSSENRYRLIIGTHTGAESGVYADFSLKLQSGGSSSYSSENGNIWLLVGSGRRVVISIGGTQWSFLSSGIQCNGKTVVSAS